MEGVGDGRGRARRGGGMEERGEGGKIEKRGEDRERRRQREGKRRCTRNTLIPIYRFSLSVTRVTPLVPAIGSKVGPAENLASGFEPVPWNIAYAQAGYARPRYHYASRVSDQYWG